MVDSSQVSALIADRPPSLGRMFFNRVQATPQREAYRYPSGSTWTSVTWEQTGDRVRRIAAGLIALGVQQEERVAIASSTRFEWILADLAIMSCGAATTTVYPSSLAEDVAFILGDSGSRIVFAEDATQVDKLRDHRSALPSVAKVVLFDGKPEAGDEDWVIGLADLEALGAEHLMEDRDAVSRRTDATKSDDLATLIYTSGTTGRPKGVRLPHSAWTYEAVAVQTLDILSMEDLQFLWLPLAHSFGKVLLSLQLAVGFPTAVDGRVEKIVDNLAQVQPTFMGAAPRIFEKAHARIVTMTSNEGGIKKTIFDRAFAVGLAVDKLRFEGAKVPPLLAAQHRVFDRLVFAKIRARFGGKLRFFVSGAAALDRDIAEWFHAAGILILEGYGLTETAAGSCVNLPSNYRLGSVGLPFPGTDVRTDEDGEILVRGPGVMERYHEAASPESLTVEDGWLRTGDIGEIDGDGFVWVKDRKKDLFKTSGGKYVAPQHVEGVIKAACPYLSQVVVYGAGRNFVSAIITLDQEAIGEWAQRHGMSGRSYAEIVTSDAVGDLVQGYIDTANASLNRWETVKKFVILERDLTIEQDELTPSLKVKRRVVQEHYLDRLDRLYA